MDMEMSVGQRSRVGKIERLRQYFGPTDPPEIYEYDATTDEGVDWKGMSDEDVAKRLNKPA